MLMLSSKKDNRGFSLIELIIVIAILAVFLGAGAFGMTLLTGAEAKQAANKFSSELNDVKTGNLARASEVLTLTYFAEADVDATKGIDRAGYYVIKDSYTIMNTAPDADIKVSLAGKDGSGNFLDREYSYLGNSRVEVAAVYTDGTTADPKTTPVEIEFSRKDGSLINASATLDYVTFKSGTRVFGIDFVPSTGTHNFVDGDPGTVTP